MSRLRTALNITASAALILLSMIMVFIVPTGHCHDFSPGIAEPQTTVSEIMTGPQNRPRADTYYLMALAAARKSRNREAMKYIEQGLKIERDNSKLLNLRAALWAAQGHLREALEQFKSVLRLSPNDTYARESVKSIEKILNPQPNINLAMLPAKIPKNKFVEPAAPVKEISSSLPASSTKILQSAYFDQVKGKQRCYYGMTAIKRAQEAFEKKHADKKGNFDTKVLIDEKLLQVMPICPESGVYSWKGGPQCSVHGDFGTIENEVKTVFSDFNSGMQAKISRNYPEAQKTFQQVVAVYPMWAEAHFQLGDTCFRTGHDKQAIEELRSCLKIDAKNLDAKLLLANLYFKVSQKDASLKLLDEVTADSRGTVYGLAARSTATSIRAGRNYYQIFPPP